MKYDISKSTAPKMPNLGRAQNASKSCFRRCQKTCKTLCFDFFPLFGTLLSDAEIPYTNLIWEESCGMMANLVAENGG